MLLLCDTALSCRSPVYSNECKASKPNVEAERREGRGGGFNEREDVVYKTKSTEDDDKYDVSASDAGRICSVQIVMRCMLLAVRMRHSRV